MVVHTLILALSRMRQEDLKFKPSLSYIIRLSGIRIWKEGKKAGRQADQQELQLILENRYEWVGEERSWERKEENRA